MYHDCYNIVYNNYNCGLDVDILNSYCEINNINSSYLLEVGCGTGRHTALLSKHFQEVYAVDVDRQMIKRAEQHILELGIKNVFFLHSSALEVQTASMSVCDVSCAFFNVINYVLNFDDLVSFFSGISKHLKPLGVCVFDCLDTSKQYEKKSSNRFVYEVGNRELARSIESEYDSLTQVLQVNERYSGLNDAEPEVYQHFYKLWNVGQVESAAKRAGLSIVDYDKKQNFSAEDSSNNRQNQALFFFKKE